MVAVFSVLTYSILFRFLSEADMGNWIFFQFAFLLLDALRTGMLQTGLIKFYSGASAERQASVAGSAWYIGILITAFFVLLNIPAFFTLHLIADEGVLLLLKWFSISLIATLPYNVALWILQAEQKFDIILYIRIISQGSFIALIGGLYIFSHVSLNSVLYSFLASSLLSSIICFIYGWSGISNLKHKTTACVQELFRFGKYSVGTFLCSNLLRTSDTFIIKFMLGPAPLAIYNLSQRLLETIEIPLRSALYTAMPDMSAAVNQNQEEKVIFIMKKYAGMLTLLFIPIAIGVFIFADLVILIIGGEKYVGTEAANIYRIFMLFAILFPVERFLGITLDIINKPHLNLIKVIVALTVNVIGDFVSIYFFNSIYGVALATIFTFVAGLLYGYWALNKYLPLNFNGFLQIAFSEASHIVMVFFRKLNFFKS